MGIAIVDSKKRIVLQDGRPGDVFDIQQQSDGRFLLVRAKEAGAYGTYDQKRMYEGHA
jgi:hypothetical protein